MLAFSIFLFMPTISVLLCHIITKREIWQKDTIIEYVIDYLVLILLINLSMSIMGKENLIDQITLYPMFTYKFTIFSTVMTSFWGILKGCLINKRCMIVVENFKVPYINNTIKNIIYYGTVFFFIFLNFIRIFEMNYWGDEGFSIRLAKMNIHELISATAEDVHPPLYYIILRIFYLVFGDHGYTYHFVSAILVIIMIIFAATIIKKKYGMGISLLFIILTTFLDSCFSYNLEIRMYSMANLFVFLCFWYGVELLFATSKRLNWVLFTTFGILAAYTHYYALLSVFIIFVVIFILLIAKEHKNLWKCMISGIVCIIVYLPWLGILFTTFGRTSSSWWLSYIPSFKDSILFLMGTSVFSKYILFIVCISMLIYFIKLIYLYKPIYLVDELHIDLNFIKICAKNREIMSIMIATIVILGTIGVGIGISYIFRPLFLTRYLFCLVGVFCICVAIFIGRAISNRKLLTLIILIAILLGSISWTKNFKNEIISNQTTVENVQYLDSVYRNGDRVVTNIRHFDWTIFDCYFNFQVAPYDGFTEDYINNTTWLILEKGTTVDEDFITQVESRNGFIEYVREGNIGGYSNYSFNLYKVVIETN